MTRPLVSVIAGPLLNARCESVTARSRIEYDIYSDFRTVLNTLYLASR